MSNFSKHKLLIAILLICLGSFIQSLSIIKSGINYSYGIGFWGANAHDGLWHVSLINQLSKLTLAHPTFSGYTITNYHYGFDLIAAILHKISHIPILTLYFQILPVFTSLIIGILTYKLTRTLSWDQLASIWAVFFTYFGGSFGFIVGLLKGEGINRESAFWSIQSASYLVNPPFTLSVIFLLTGLICLLNFLKNKSKRFLVFSILLFGSVILVKVYAGLIVLSSLFVVGAIKIAKEKDVRIFSIFLMSSAISVALFLLTNKDASGLVKFEPLWFPRTMIEFKDRVGWEKLANARQVYMATKNYLKWIPAELLGVCIFIVGNLGTRIIGLKTIFSYLKTKKIDTDHSKETIYLLLAALTIFSIVPTLLFVQKGNPWNIIQFFYYAQIFLGLMAGLAVSKIRLSLALVIIIITLPTTLGSLQNYLPQRPPAAITQYEFKALEFLRLQPQGIVLTYPYNRDKFNQFHEPRPVYAYESTAYVSAISNHQTFLEDEMNLEISAYPWEQRREKVESFFKNSDNNATSKFLKDNHISYIYLLEGQDLAFGPEQTGLVQIYDNPHKVRIFHFSGNI